MKTLSTLFITPLVVTILLFLSPEFLSAQNGGKSGARIQRTNWSNSMECDFVADECVVLAEDELLWFKLIAQFADPDISNYPAIHFRYFFPDYNPNYPLHGITPAVTQAMVEPALLENGDSAYRAYFPFEFQLAEHCGGSHAIPFGVEYQMVTKVGSAYLPYPAAAFPTLFPPDTFNIASNGFARYDKLDRHICCSGNGVPCPTSFHHQGNTISRENDGDELVFGRELDPHISPNPFTDFVNVQLPVGILEETFFLKIYDTQGRQIFSHRFIEEVGRQSKMISTEDWSPGIYIFRISSDHHSFVQKMIKG